MFIFIINLHFDNIVYSSIQHNRKMDFKCFQYYMLIDYVSVKQ